jgi:hypothetical protein
VNWAVLVRLGVWLETQLNHDVVACGRSVDDVEDSVLISHGRFLGYRIAIDKGWILLWLQALDSPVQGWDFVLKAPEDRKGEGFKKVSQVIRALERQKIKTLDRPIVTGIGPNDYAIS